MTERTRSNHSTSPWPSEAGGFPALLDRYRILGILGEGGMGTVFKAYHLNLKRHVALKTLRLDRERHPDLVSRFLQEMESIGQMDHPNVVRAADAGEKNGVFYLVMDYLTGMDLGRLVNERGRLRPPDACELIRQAAVGLDYVHRTLVHRDVKPSNLLLTTDGVVKLLDLGLARLHESATAGREQTPAGCAVGTYDYMAPEQAAAGAVVDGRADLYGLGCTLFRLLTGRAPFSAPEYDTTARKLYAHAHVPLSTVPGFETIPEVLRPVLLRMTAKNPAERYATARQVAETLTPFAVGAHLEALLGAPADAVTPVRPLPSPVPEELSRLTEDFGETPTNLRTVPTAPPAPAPTGRRRLLFGIVGLACLVAVLTGYFAPHLFHRDQPGPAPNAGEKDDKGETPRPGPEEFALPLPASSLPSLERLRPLEQHDLLRQSQRPPLLIGFRQDDGLSSGRWTPGRQQLEINPADAVLVLLATTERDKPGFTFQTLVDQRPWSGAIGLFWGYQEDAAVKAARTPGKEFARYQLLLLTRSRDKQGAPRFFIERATATLQYTQEGRVSLASQHTRVRQPLPTLANEKTFEIVVDNARLKQVRFGGTELTELCTAAVNKEFRPTDYRGALGLVTFSANVTFRRPWVMPHAEN